MVSVAVVREAIRATSEREGYLIQSVLQEFGSFPGATSQRERFQCDQYCSSEGSLGPQVRERDFNAISIAVVRGPWGHKSIAVTK